MVASESFGGGGGGSADSSSGVSNGGAAGYGAGGGAGGGWMLLLEQVAHLYGVEQAVTEQTQEQMQLREFNPVVVVAVGQTFGLVHQEAVVQVLQVV